MNQQKNDLPRFDCPFCHSLDTQTHFAPGPALRDQSYEITCRNCNGNYQINYFDGSRYYINCKTCNCPIDRSNFIDHQFACDLLMHAAAGIPSSTKKMYLFAAELAKKIRESERNLVAHEIRFWLKDAATSNSPPNYDELIRKIHEGMFRKHAVDAEEHKNTPIEKFEQNWFNSVTAEKPKWVNNPYDLAFWDHYSSGHSEDECWQALIKIYPNLTYKTVKDIYIKFKH